MSIILDHKNLALNMQFWQHFRFGNAQLGQNAEKNGNCISGTPSLFINIKRKDIHAGGNQGQDQRVVEEVPEDFEERCSLM